MSITYIKPSLANRLPYYKLINDITLGWNGIVEAKTTYLPASPSEIKNPTKYTSRWNLATYEDFYNPTVEGITGLIFKKPIKLNDDVPQQLQDDLVNANAMGDDFGVVAGQLFNGALRKGIKFALVDMPKGQSNNRAEEIAQGIKPYITLIDVENVTSWKTELIAGQIVLTQVKIREFAEVADADNPYAVETEERYRVLEIKENIVTWTLFDDEGEVLDNGTLGNINFIPLYALNLDDVGYFEANPPLYEVAKLNIRHYQMFSDSSYASHIACVPFYVASGVQGEETENMTISPNTMLNLANPDAKIEIVSYDGKGIETNDILMKKIEKRINEIGFSVVQSEKEMTATESNITNGQKQSKLNRYADRLKDTLENILNAMSIMGGYSTNGGGTAEISADILNNPLTAQEVTSINNAVSSGNISRESMWDMISTGSISFSDDWTPEKEEQNIEEEGLLTPEVNNDNT